MELARASRSPPNAHCYSILARTYSAGGQRAVVAELYERMLTEGVAPDLVMYNVILHHETRPVRTHDSALSRLGWLGGTTIMQVAVRRVQGGCLASAVLDCCGYARRVRRS